MLTMIIIMAGDRLDGQSIDRDNNDLEAEETLKWPCNATMKFLPYIIYHLPYIIYHILYTIYHTLGILAMRSPLMIRPLPYEDPLGERKLIKIILHQMSTTMFTFLGPQKRFNKIQTVSSGT